MTDDNLRYWEEFRQPPEAALSKIKAGRLKNKTDIKPIWRIKKMTEMFGPCGIGWKFAPVKQWTEPGPFDQVFAFVNVEISIKVDGEWSEPIHGNGGSKLVVKESSGLYCDDDAFKKATTDALSSAMKMIGMAADIYMGSFDGSKYNTPKPVIRSYATKGQFQKFKDYCVKESLIPKEIAVLYGITTKMTPDKFDISLKNIKKDVEAGEIGYRFAIPEEKKTEETENE